MGRILLFNSAQNSFNIPCWFRHVTVRARLQASSWGSEQKFRSILSQEAEAPKFCCWCFVHGLLKLSNTWQTAVGAQGPGSQREMEIPSADPETSGRINCSVSNKGKTSTLVRAIFTFGDSKRERCRKQRMPESVRSLQGQKRNPKTGRLEPLQNTDCGGNHTLSIGLNSSRGSVFHSSIPEEPGRTIFIQVATIHSAGEIQQDHQRWRYITVNHLMGI